MKKLFTTIQAALAAAWSWLASAGRTTLAGIRGFAAWFSPELRQAIQGAAVALIGFLAAIGWVGSGHVQAWEAVLAAALQVFTGLLAWANLSPSQAATWFAAGGRATIYGLATTVAPSLQLLGLVTETQAAAALQQLSILLSLLASLVAAVNRPLELTPTEREADEQAEASRAAIRDAADADQV